MSSSITLKKITKAGELLKKLGNVLDHDQDGKITLAELNYAKNVATQRGDAVTADALDAIWSLKNSTSVGVFNASTDATIAKLQAADTNGDGKLDAAEQKKLKSNTTTAVAAFAAKHGYSSVDSFHIPGPATTTLPKDDGFVPTGADAKAQADSLVTHYNRKGNDNYWPGGVTSRYVMDTTESAKVIRALERLPKTKAKAILKAIADSIQAHQQGCYYPVPAAVPQFDALAKKLGVTANFAGKASAPAMGGW